MKKVVVLSSGGIDSTTLLYHFKALGYEVRALTINYGQRHAKELTFIRYHTDKLGILWTCVDLHSLSLILPGNSQTDPSVAVPEGHYTEESMKKTVVPNRNMILLSIAIGHAIAHKMDAVAYAAHASDHAIYPDCRPEFADWINQGPSQGLCDWHKVELLRPFIRMTKSEVVHYGWRSFQIDYSQTWSCYKGRDLHCGQCGTCTERKEAFQLAGVPDPTAYEK